VAGFVVDGFVVDGFVAGGVVVGATVVAGAAVVVDASEGIMDIKEVSSGAPADVEAFDCAVDSSRVDDAGTVKSTDSSVAIKAACAGWLILISPAVDDTTYPPKREIYINKTAMIIIILFFIRTIHLFHI